MLHSTRLSQLLTSSSSSSSSSSLSSSFPMLHCVWAYCSSDRPLGGQFNSQVSERSSSDTEVKCLVFGICRRLSGESACLPHIPHNRPQTNGAKLNKGKEDRGENEEETLILLGGRWGQERCSKAEDMNKTSLDHLFST